MKELSGIPLFKKLQELCDQQMDAQSYIRSFFDDNITDIKHVRLDREKHELVVGVEPWVWVLSVKTVLERNKEAIHEFFGMHDIEIKVIFLFSS